MKELTKEETELVQDFKQNAPRLYWWLAILGAIVAFLPFVLIVAGKFIRGKLKK